MTLIDRLEAAETGRDSVLSIIEQCLPSAERLARMMGATFVIDPKWFAALRSRKER